MVCFFKRLVSTIIKDVNCLEICLILLTFISTILLEINSLNYKSVSCCVEYIYELK